MKVEGKIVLGQADLETLLLNVLSSKMGLSGSLAIDFNFTQKRKGDAGLETVIEYAGDQDVLVLTDALNALIAGDAPVKADDYDEEQEEPEEEEEQEEAPKSRRGRKAATKVVEEEEEEEDDEEEEEEEPAPKSRLAGRRKAAPEPEPEEEEEDDEEEEPAPRRRGRPAAKVEPEAPARRRRLTK